MKRRTSYRARPWVAALLTLSALVSPVHGQGGGELIGAALDARSLKPLEGVRAELVGLGLSARTDASGTFSFESVVPGEVTIRLTFGGYGSVVERVTVTREETTLIQFHLLPVEAVLNEILVQVQRSEDRVGHSEARVSGEGPATLTAADLLAQRVPGLTIDRGGAVGGGAKVLIRGLNSMNGSNAPVIYLDGVPIGDRSTALRGSREPQAFHVLEQIPASDVRQIRVLRGPAASARYTGGAAGVILVETRRGTPSGSN